MILIGLGSSLAFCGRPPQEIVSRAIAAVGEFAAVRAVSQYYRSPAWPDASDPPFINAVIAVETGLAPAALLAALHAVEAGFGRRRTRKYGPRTLDLDLLDYNGQVREAGPGGGPELPHSGVATRDFVLLPLAEVAPSWTHPVSGETVAALIGRLERRGAEPIGA